MRDYYRVYANIDLDAIYENVVNAKKLTKPGTKLMAIIKADAYGHGAVEVARTLDDVADAYGVAILEEGIELRQAGIDKPVLILGYTPKALYPAMIKHDIATAVFTWEMAQEISQTAEALGRTARIHIKLDTGMSRIGFKQDDESLETICRIAKLPNISIDGCFTHFARMDETDKTWALKQFERYQNFVKRLEEAGVTFPVKHVSNSAGIIEMPQVNLDMVRDGIAVYGMYPSEEVDKSKILLRPAMELKAYVSYVKTLEPGVHQLWRHIYDNKRDKSSHRSCRIRRWLSESIVRKRACPDSRTVCTDPRKSMHGSVYGGRHGYSGCHTGG